jgi:hypothetical protein
MMRSNPFVPPGQSLRQVRRDIEAKERRRWDDTLAFIAAQLPDPSLQAAYLAGTEQKRPTRGSGNPALQPRGFQRYWASEVASMTAPENTISPSRARSTGTVPAFGLGGGT